MAFNRRAVTRLFAAGPVAATGRAATTAAQPARMQGAGLILSTASAKARAAPAGRAKEAGIRRASRQHVTGRYPDLAMAPRQLVHSRVALRAQPAVAG